MRALLSGTVIVRLVWGGRRNLGKSLGWGLGLHCEQEKLLACAVAEIFVVTESFDSVAERFVVRGRFESVAEIIVVRESFDSVAERFVVRECFDSDAAEI